MREGLFHTGVMLGFLDVLCALLLLIIVPVSALSFTLDSSDFNFDPATSMTDNIRAATSSRCFLIELRRRNKQWGGKYGAGVFGFIRFVATSNVTSVDLRNNLVLSTHPPSTDNEDVAHTGITMGYQVFGAREIEERRRAAVEKGQRLLKEKRTREAGLGQKEGMRLEGQPTQTQDGSASTDHETPETFNENVASSFSYTVTTEASGPGAFAAASPGTQRAMPVTLEGNYAVCFSLDRTSTPAGRQGRTTALHERVSVDVLELYSSSSATTGSYTFRSLARQAVNAATGNQKRVLTRLGGRTTAGADREFERRMRDIYKAKDDVSVNALLVKQRDELDRADRQALEAGDGALVGAAGIAGGVYTAAQLRENSRELLKTQRMTFNVIESTTEHLRRSERMQDTAESTFTRIWVAFVFVLAAITVTVYITFSYTKHIIIKKKLV